MVTPLYAAVAMLPMVMAENHADDQCANEANCVSSPDVRAFLQMDNPKHQSDPSEDEDERSSRKVIKQKEKSLLNFSYLRAILGILFTENYWLVLQ